MSTLTHAASHQTAKIPMFGWLLQSLIAIALLLAAALLVVEYPVARLEIAVGLAIYAVLLIRLPWLWMLAIPLLLPVLDLNLWSGRIYLSEFDFVVLSSAGIGLLRRDTWLENLEWRKRHWALLALLIAWQAATTLRGLLPLQSVDSNSLTSLYSHYNSLRLVKGFLLALLLIPLLGQSLGREEQTGKILAWGMILGCLAAIAALVWERALFTGLLNFTKDYRATGLFSGTATGGAAVDAHLLLTLPFLLLLFIYFRNAWLHLLGIVLCGLGLYACFITFSRANYPALGVGLAVFLGGWLYLQLRHHKLPVSLIPKKGFWPALFIVPFAGYLFLSSPYLSSRFATTWSDLQTRLDHWSKIVQLMQERKHSTLAGMGKGSFPRVYFWSFAGEEMPSTAVHIKQANESFIRMAKSDVNGTLFLRQRFSFQGEGSYRLKLALRPTEDRPARILVEFCERLVFKSYRECRWLGFDSNGDPTRWQEFNKRINLHNFGKRYWYGSRPVEISILNRGINQPLDVGRVELYGPAGRQLLANTTFEQGWDRWTLYSGDHLSWHIKNIFVDAFFEGGWPGLTIFILLILAISLKLWRSIINGSTLALAIAASVSAGIMVGLFDSLFDEPRITLLFYLLLWITLSLHVPNLQTETFTTHGESWIKKGIMAGETLVTKVLATTNSVLNSRYRLAIMSAVVVVIAVPMYLAADRYFAHRHWMKAWNTLFSGTSTAIPLTADTALVTSPAPGRVLLDGEEQPNIAQAFKKAGNGSLIQIQAGHYHQAAMLQADNVKVIADPGVAIYGKAAGRKGALVIRGNNTYLEGFECHSIAVRDNNGVCVRLEGNGLILNRVYFHDSQGGLMGSPKGGDVVIENSRFENMGTGAFFHGIYLLSDMNSLIIRNSVFLNTRSAGHEIKSRARRTEITNSIIAASQSRDSRLVDIPNGGNLILRDNVFIEGPNSENADLFSWGVEGVHNSGEIVIEDNVIVSDKSVANLIAIKGSPSDKRVTNNVVIGRIFGIDDNDNVVFKDRKAAGIPAAPFIPRLHELIEQISPVE